jgi:hypothetical protein
MKKFLLKDKKSISNLIDYLYTIDWKELEKKPLDVTIKNFVRLSKEETTRAAQNRLRWLWITDIADKMGLSKDDCNQFLKERLLLPIYVRDSQDWAETMLSIRQLELEGYKDQAKQLKRFVCDEKRLSFIDATVSQGAEFLNEVKLFAHEQGWSLTTDIDYHQDDKRC